MPTLTGPSRSSRSGLPADSVMIMLHGLGANGDDLISLAGLFAGPLPNTFFYSPNAPDPYDKAPSGFQWYSISDDLSKTDGLYRAAESVNAYVDQVLAHHRLEPSRCVLLGFSQGTILALHVALRRPAPLAGVLGYSGLLMAADKLKEEMASRPSICLIHGADDRLLPHEATKEANALFTELKVPNEGHILPNLGHSIDQRGIDLGIGFLRKVLGTPPEADA